jgi:hypothetical protein
LAVAGCARTATVLPSQPPLATSGSVVCDGLRGHFLPISTEAGSEGIAQPAAGRFWVRQCDFGLGTDGLFHVGLRGPAWVWVERDDPPYHLKQYVYFHVDARLAGTIEKDVGWKDGVVSLWFRSTNARVDIEQLGSIRVRTDGLWASVLARLALPITALNVDARARQQVEAEVTDRFEAALRRGFTVVYDVLGEQPDFALGLLGEGEVPQHPFSDGRPWLANERLIAAPGGMHVLGPFEPNEAMSLEARVTYGPALAWRRLCVSELERAFAGVERGEPGRVPDAAILDSGTFSGLHAPEAELGPVECRSYVVVSTVGKEATHAAIRVRPT